MLLLDNDTEAPLGPAGPLRVTVPVEELPPSTALGLRTIEAIVAGMMVSDADTVFPPLAAEIVATVWEPTPRVLTVNVAEV